MEKIVIDKCSACTPVNRLLNEIIAKGYSVINSKIEDYHFHQLYFKVNAKIDLVKEIDISGFTLNDNFLICDCHWSRIEFKGIKTELS